MPKGVYLRTKEPNEWRFFRKVAVTHAENISRGQTGIHQRLKTHCPQGHPYSSENTYHTNQGSRSCRICVCRSNAAGRLRAKGGQ